ncbi:MAG: response regulator, partial [Chloroflexia bacterium]|nr:response regulator [Chloroflexia bacterium]
MQAQLLVVGDDSLIELSRSTVTDKEGFTLLVAHSQAEARELLGQQYPAIILIAQMLPDGSGLALLRTLQQECFPVVPILVLDAPEEEAFGLEALRTGAFACLSMPINADLLHLMLVRAN